MTPRSFPRVLALLLSTLLLVACDGGGAAPDEAAGPSDDGGSTEGEEPSSNVTEGCVEDATEDVDYFPDEVEFTEATGVDVAYSGTYKVVEITLPDAPDDEPFRLVLHQCGTPEPELDPEIADAPVIEVPVSEVVSLTTTNLPHFEELGATDRLVGVGTPGFVATESVRERIDAGEIEGFADAEGQPDLERIVAATPDLLVFDGFGDAVRDEVGRYLEAGVPTAINADFNEQTLLGRAEWLKFTALFLNAEAEATTRYEEIAGRYQEIVERAGEADEQPTVFANTPFEGTWFVPGGQSFLANAIADAGGEYVFADDDSTGGIQVDFETVLDEAGDADVWIQAGSMHGTLDDLLADDERFAEFRAFQEGEVYAYDRWLTEGGGNAVFETAYTRADLFLADLGKIFHPDQFEDHEFVFFGRVPAESADD